MAMDSSPSSSYYVHANTSVFMRDLQDFDVSYTNSPGFGFPFTNGQWKELERQAMVFKYMAASVPVPNHLLLALTRDQALGHGGLKLRFPGNGDLEPGRCKRTDGKKWRCSRNVAGVQKYCERHLHRGRPRSRKPVEPSATKRTRRNTTPSATPTAVDDPVPMLLESTVFFENLNYRAPNLEPRSLGWMDLNSAFYTNFIDENNVINSTNQRFDSSLSHSMGVIDSIEDKSHYPNSLSSDCSSWVGSFTPGGPLAEVLRTAGRVSSESSPVTGNGNWESPVGTAVSSPHKVFCNMVTSLSDSSRQSSPTLASSTALPEIALQWLI